MQLSALIHCFVRSIFFYISHSFSNLNQQHRGLTLISASLDSVVAKPCVKMTSRSPRTTLSKFEPDESWLHYLGICLCHQGRKIH